MLKTNVDKNRHDYCGLQYKTILYSTTQPIMKMSYFFFSDTMYLHNIGIMRQIKIFEHRVSRKQKAKFTWHNILSMRLPEVKSC